MSDSDRPLAFEPLPDATGLEIVDRIEQERCVCRSDEAISPTPVSTDNFRFPVDHAVRISASELRLPNVSGVFARDESDQIVSQVQRLDADRLPSGRYNLELLTQFKTYLAVNSSVDIAADATEFSLDFGSETEILMGARSNHERPAATIRTTKDPLDMMAAVETFSSALKTMAPDRSLPSLRGHPPSVELGDELDIPSSVNRADSGITLELPALREVVYVAAPLAYYLGADIEPGPNPRLVTEEGFEYPLMSPLGYEKTVERTLKQLFFLDCVTRTEGLYKLDLNERRQTERILDLDFGTLYEQAPAMQVERYLGVPFELLEEHIPDWRLTVHVDPRPSTIEQLPFVVDDLAIVRTQSGALKPVESANPTPADVDLESAFTRSAKSSPDTSDVDYVEPQASDSLEQAWIGDNIPIGASKLTREAFQNRLNLEPVEGDISISIVLNDPRMEEERNHADKAYGNRENLPFDVDVNQDVTKEELRDILQKDTSFLHYIGHTESDGFECPDGKLDARTLNEVGVQSFLLNTCNSYEQGLGLIQAGAVGGIVTLNDVINDGAVRIGETVSRLLNAGFPLRAALSIARNESILGGQYIVVGDGGMTVAQPAGGLPNLLKISSQKDKYHVEIDTFTTDVAGLGAMYMPFIAGNEKHYLGSGQTASFLVTEEELQQFLLLENVPVRVGGELYWSQSLNLNEVQ